MSCVDIYSNSDINISTENTQYVIIPPKTEEVVLNPSITEQVVIPADETYFSKVTAKPVTSEIDSNIKSYNIRKGVSVLGVEGNLEPDKPDQTKTVVPTTEQQRITGDTGYELAECIVEAIPKEYLDTSNPANVYNGEVGEEQQ